MLRTAPSSLQLSPFIVIVVGVVVSTVVVVVVTIPIPMPSTLAISHHSILPPSSSLISKAFLEANCGEACLPLSSRTTEYSLKTSLAPPDLRRTRVIGRGMFVFVCLFVFFWGGKACVCEVL